MKSDLHRMQVFAQIVESGSITKAADELDVSKSVLSHHLQSLEKHLGVKLLTRTTRRQSLTEAGQRYYQRCLEMKKLMSLAEEEVRESNTDLAGTVTVTSPHTLMTHLIGPSMCRFVKNHPRIEPRLLANDMRLNLIDKYIDLSITVGELPDSSSRATKIGELEQVLCCSPEYMKSRDITLPVTSTELLEYDYIANQWEGINVERKFSVGKQSISYRFHSTRMGDSIPTIRLMTLSGLGLACLPILAIKEELERGDLVRLTADGMALKAPVWAVHNYGLQMPARIRAFIDFIKENAENTL
ncbi:MULTISPECIES: LysR family transcriptional regulator [Vibrio]|uniref:LysR family transcriptional regulator n=1 Tax=Vibrio TaxID=662 RepID=UPI001EFC8269|nr:MULTISPECIES: LysR family transcriptional regulator [Vibrio]MCG9677273.1 LysR family transcriptional regulator [Vibrio sp. Isolate24]USD35310.1 LysR family transcriptional regulator [Vibrio sp. SCSIO 43186]USD48377.1 LysR family transcriptional regulator [Vibrio sp. SCSIO 43145]USD72435.1 LysR family transcriptional regulator [Vibrio sp. SCSIO 43139]USD98112.1 LysR family transcriptional regulator [Vibrio coralliilyticus]